MSKYDCSKTTDFLHELNRRCDKEICVGCPYHENACSCLDVFIRDSNESQAKMIDYIQKWSDEHPERHENEKTILDDLKEKYPDYAHRNDNDIPQACADDLYKSKYAECNTAESDVCRKCWNRPLSEVMQ